MHRFRAALTGDVGCRAGFCPGISKGVCLLGVLALRGDLFEPGLPLDTGLSVVRSEIMEVPRCKRSIVAKLCISGRRRKNILPWTGRAGFTNST